MTKSRSASIPISVVFLLLLGFLACSDPYKLSDNAGVKSFSIDAASPAGVQFNEPLVSSSRIVLPMTKGRYSFPISITASVETNGPEQQVLNLDFSNSIEFATLTEEKEFYVTSASGLPKKYMVSLVKIPHVDDNDVELFRVGSMVTPPEAVLTDQGVIQADDKEGEIAILVQNGVYPIEFRPTMVLSLGATSSLTGLPVFKFDSATDTIRFAVISQSGKSKPWKVYLNENRLQLPNNQFEQWTDDLTPVGWATANNLMVSGTMRSNDPVYGSVVKLSTSRVEFGSIKQIAAGSLFLGHFKLDLGHMNNPPMMTYMGIPFTGKPLAAKIALNYAPGKTLEKSANGAFIPMAGIDQGNVTFELLHYTGFSKDFEYHGFDNTPNVELVARYKKRVADTKGAWSENHYPLTFYTTTKQPNYISVVFSSSADGDLFVGAAGSTLLVGAIDLMYNLND